MRRTVFFISDGTGITAESFGQSLLSQFASAQFEHITLPYIDTEKKAKGVVEQIQTYVHAQKPRPLVFSTIVNQNIRKIILTSVALVQDIFDSYLWRLEQELHEDPLNIVGKKRAINNGSKYLRRIEAVHFALEHDDGIRTAQYQEADVILVGVSRCGKTPTCLYLALQFGVCAANYPLTEENLTVGAELPEVLLRNRSKLFGLTIDPKHLSAIRQQRRPNSDYSAFSQCYLEVHQVKKLFEEAEIPYLDATRHSVEEIATRLLAVTQIERRLK